MPFQWTVTYDLINADGLRLAHVKAVTDTGESQAVAKAFLRMFSDVVEVRVTERASVSTQFSWIGVLHHDELLVCKEFDYG